MSGTIGGLANYGALGRLIGDSASVRSQLNTLTQQAASGRIADTYAGLGAGAQVSLDLNPIIAHQQTWRNNIDAATARMQVTQSAMTQIQSIASNLYGQLNTLSGLDSGSIDTTAASARQALQQVAGLLNTTDGGGVYVFAGQDTGNAPVPNADQILSSGFYTQINTAVSGLGANSITVTAATLSVAASNAPGTSPFSAQQSQSASSIPLATTVIGPSQRTTVGLLASANTFVASSGSSTTGSYMRDLMRALATVSSLSSSQTSAGGFQGLIQDTRTSLSGAISAMADDAGTLGNKQTQLAATKTELSDTSTALTGQVSSAQDVDMAATLSKITLVQTQLQASYQLISGMNGLSLAKYLPAG